MEVRGDFGRPGDVFVRPWVRCRDLARLREWLGRDVVQFVCESNQERGTVVIVQGGRTAVRRARGEQLFGHLETSGVGFRLVGKL